FEKSPEGRGLTGNEIVPDRVSGLGELRQRVHHWTPERVGDLTGIPDKDIRQAALAFGQAKNGIIIYGAEAGNHPSVRQAATNLVTVAGFVGRPNNGVIAVLPQANSRGAADLGIVPHRLPGYVPIADPGLGAQDMLHGMVRALLIAAADPMPGGARPAGLEFLMVQDLFLTETAQQAVVVLPAAAVGERDGTFTNLERWVQRFYPGLPAPGLSRPDWNIIRQLAVVLGADWAYASAGSILAEMAGTIPLYAGMIYEALSQPISLSRSMSHYIYAGMSFQAEGREGLQWPTLAEDDSATLALTWMDPPEPPGRDGGFTLASPRVLYDGGTLVSCAEILAGRLTHPHAVMSTADGRALGISSGDRMQLSANGQQTVLACRLDGGLPAGVVVIPRNLPGQPAESLLNRGHTFGPVAISLPDS
ncbi:MAG: molybdopterin-dependent oxidoreductase, partial [Gammaproteobacteria bacterium]|nr:molybdopterin-dependent oxidoreductase [Gammaproteobacteria bacterium]